MGKTSRVLPKMIAQDLQEIALNDGCRVFEVSPYGTDRFGLQFAHGPGAEPLFVSYRAVESPEDVWDAIQRAVNDGWEVRLAVPKDLWSAELVEPSLIVTPAVAKSKETFVEFLQQHADHPVAQRLLALGI